jgi:hypothetical protein
VRMARQFATLNQFIRSVAFASRRTPDFTRTAQRSDKR